MKRFCATIILCLFALSVSAQNIVTFFQEEAGAHRPVASGGDPVVNTGLIGHWKLNEHSSTDYMIYDSWSTNNGTAQQLTLLLSTNGVSSHTGGSHGALSFNGSSDYVSVPDNSNLNFAGDFSISAWIKTTSASEQLVVAKGHVNYHYVSYAVPQYQGVITVLIGDGSSGYYLCFNGTRNISDGNWHLINITVSGTTGSIYIDGSVDGTGTASGSRATGSDPMVIGAKGYSGESRFNGSIDDVRIYSRALTTDEISQLYNGGAGTEAQ